MEGSRSCCQALASVPGCTRIACGQNVITRRYRAGRIPFQGPGAVAQVCHMDQSSPRRRGRFATLSTRVTTKEAPPSVETTKNLTSRDDIRNIAIIAHVDHGKTTLVDALLRQAHVFRDNQAVDARVMDSMSLERERGITILSKNTAIRYGSTKINIIDTPGHADFGGEVERVLNMADGVLLLVDAVEGPMPQTRFVLKKALDLDKKVLVVVNKVDRDAARPDWALDTTFDLFVDLGASDEQCDFPVVYASGLAGRAGVEAHELQSDLTPLFEAILREISPPLVDASRPLQMLVTNLDYDEHKGRVAIGRVHAGAVHRGQPVVHCRAAEGQGDTGPVSPAKISELFVYDNFSRLSVEHAEAGDIVALTGLSAVSIGDTVCAAGGPPRPLPAIKVEEPTVRMTFSVNTSPFAGKEGKYVTSRNLGDRLRRELERNLALRVEGSAAGAESFDVSGRGTLHLGILMETMRREGFEFCVGPPTVITRHDSDTGAALEPIEEAIIEVPEEHVGSVTEALAGRKAAMVSMAAHGTVQRLTYRLPTRGLLGLRSALLTATRGAATLATVVVAHEPWQGDLATRETGSLVAHETGQATAYALDSAQARGRLFCRPQEAVYAGQVVGAHSRAGDLSINICKRKQLTNMRAAGKDTSPILSEPIAVTLDFALEYVGWDELVEITPASIRIRKNPARQGKDGKRSRSR